MLEGYTGGDVIAFTQQLVRLPSLPGREGAVAGAVEAKMRALDYDRVWTDEYGSVVGVLSGDEPGPTILFDSHSDTVEITSADAWQHDPLGAELESGKIWGRGATDMKGALAATVVALGQLPRHLFRGTIAVSASVGEEVLEGAALAHVMARVKPDMVVICEPSGCKIGIGQKGRTGISIEVRGKPAHTSRPHLGNNAVYRMLPIVERLRAIDLPNDGLLGRGVMELVEIQSSPLPGKSIVPDGCRVAFDRRLVRGETMDSVLDSIRVALADLQDWNVAFNTARVDCYTGQVLEKTDFHAAWSIDQLSPFLLKAMEGLKAAGLEPDFYAAPFCTNGSYSAGVAHVPTLIFGPSTVELAHAVDEYVDIDELLRGAAGFIGLATWLGQELEVELPSQH